MKKIAKILMILLAVLLVLFGVFLIYASRAEYKPAEKLLLYQSESPEVFNDSVTLNILSWNIGYAGLNKDMDFFYDGGNEVRTSRKQTIESLSEIQNFLSGQETVDFFLLQEVDKASKRSYYINQVDSFGSLFPDMIYSYALNYNVFFVPIPIFKPMGQVQSGLLTMSRYKAMEAVRYDFPGSYDWPKRLFMLQRCFLTERYPLASNAELLIINTHNSAFDDGSIKEQEMQYLKKFLEQEYAKGNYIIVGGDWNQAPPGYSPKFKNDVPDTDYTFQIPEDFLPDWQWVYDAEKPTNRNLKTGYTQGETPTLLIDFFLLSPNIQSLSVETIDLGFQHSDHQPVKLKAKLKTYAGDL